MQHPGPGRTALFVAVSILSMAAHGQDAEHVDDDDGAIEDRDLQAGFRHGSSMDQRPFRADENRHCRAPDLRLTTLSRHELGQSA